MKGGQRGPAVRAVTEIEPNGAVTLNHNADQQNPDGSWGSGETKGMHTATILAALRRIEKI